MNLFFIRLTQGWKKARRKLDQKKADYEVAIEEQNDLREDYENVKKEYNDQDRRYDGISSLRLVIIIVFNKIFHIIHKICHIVSQS